MVRTMVAIHGWLHHNRRLQTDRPLDTSRCRIGSTRCMRSREASAFVAYLACCGYTFHVGLLNDASKLARCDDHPEYPE